MLAQVRHMALYLMFFSTQFVLGWPLVQFWNASDGTGQGSDARAILDVLECIRNSGLGQYFSLEAETTCPVYIYGVSLAALATALSLGAWATIPFSWLSVLVLSILFGWMQNVGIRKRGRWFGVLVFSLSISPPIQLLLQRANFDTLVFVGVVAGAILAAKNKSNLAILVLLFASGLKFYSVFAISAVGLWLKAPKSFVVLGIAQVIGVGIVFFELFSRRESFEQIPSDGGASFGLTVLPRVWNIGVDRIGLEPSIPSDLFVVAGILVFVPVLALVILAQAKTRFLDVFTIEMPRNSTFGALGALTGTVFLSCFFAGTNYDYRLIFLLPFGLWVVSEMKKMSWQKYILSLSLVGSFWFSFIPTPAQLLGDFFVSIWAAIGLVITFRLLTLAVKLARNSFTP